MILYEAVIDGIDHRQLLAIRDKLAHLDQRIVELIPKSQFSVFLKPREDWTHLEEIDICVAIDGELTAPLLTKLEQEVEATFERKHTAPRALRPRFIEKLICL